MASASRRVRSGRDAEFFQRLFAYDATGWGCGEENGVGDPAAESVDEGFAGAGPVPCVGVSGGIFYREEAFLPTRRVRR